MAEWQSPMARTECRGKHGGRGQCILHSLDAAPCPRSSGRRDAEGRRPDEMAGTIPRARASSFREGLRSGRSREHSCGSVPRHSDCTGSWMAASGQALVQGLPPTAGAFPARDRGGVLLFNRRVESGRPAHYGRRHCCGLFPRKVQRHPPHYPCRQVQRCSPDRERGQCITESPRRGHAAVLWPGLPQRDLSAGAAQL